MRHGHYTPLGRWHELVSQERKRELKGAQLATWRDLVSAMAQLAGRVSERSVPLAIAVQDWDNALVDQLRGVQGDCEGHELTASRTGSRTTKPHDQQHDAAPAARKCAHE